MEFTTLMFQKFAKENMLLQYIIVLFLIKNRGIINIIIFVTFPSLNNLFLRNATEISCIYILGWIFLSSCLISVCRSVVSFSSSEMYNY